jgi:hypothetical protein
MAMAMPLLRLVFCTMCGVNIQIPALRHRVSGIVSLLGTQGYPLPTRYLFQHHQRRVPLGRAIGLGELGIDDQVMGLLRQQIAVVAELGLFAMPLRANSASGSVVDTWVWLLRCSP